MSKRFGRNRKRRMQQEIAVLQQRWEGEAWHHQQTRKSAAIDHSKLMDLKAEVTKWAGIILRNTREDSLFHRELQVLEINPLMMEYIKLGRPEQRRTIQRESRGLTGYPPEFETSFEIIKLYGMFVETEQSFIEDAVAFKVRSGVESWAMMIDNATLLRELEHDSGGVVGEHLYQSLLQEMKKYAQTRHSNRRGIRDNFSGACR